MKLTDKYISNLKHLDKDQFFSQEGVEGLTLRIYKYLSTAKTWFYQYRPKGKSSVRIKIDPLLTRSTTSVQTIKIDKVLNELSKFLKRRGGRVVEGARLESV